MKIIILFLVGIFFTNSAFAQTNENMLTVVFVDLGYSGDSTLVIFPNGTTLLIDGGWYYNSSYEKLADTLNEYGVAHIDAIMATHADADHYGGLTEILTRDDFTVGEVLTSPVHNDKATYLQFLDGINSSDFGLRELTMADILNLDDSVLVDILSPPESLLEPNKEKNENDNSIVTRVEYGDITFLFTGDATKTAEQFMINQYDPEILDIEIMNSPHHGSEVTSNSQEFILATSPQLVIFSANQNNTHGHPHQNTINLYSQHGATTLQTGIIGNIEIQTDGVRCSVIVQGDEQPCYPGVQVVPEFPFAILAITIAMIPVIILGGRFAK